MIIRKSNLVEHQEYIFRIRKKNWATVGRTEMIEYAEKVLKPIKCLGLNPYKMVEIFKNYRPVVPVEFHSDELNAEPSSEVWSKVKVEKTDRSEFRANLKAKNMRGRSELKRRRSTAMRATTAKRVGRRRVFFFSSRGFSPTIIV